MKLFKSNETNTFHYLTLATYDRVAVFRSDRACEIFVNTLEEVRRRYPYKLVGYVMICAVILRIGNGRVIEPVCRTRRVTCRLRSIGKPIGKRKQ
jgi:hypothetical protein